MEHLGLVGLPDSGHAQLFSALTGIDVPTGFETTKGVAPLPDDRVDRLAEMSKSKKRVHATFEIDFIPGLAPGGKPGEGLGSRLLGSIRDCDAILAVVRADDDADPADALEALELELVLADLASVEQRLDKQRRALKGDKTLAGEVAALERGEGVLSGGTPVYRSDLTAEERALLGPVFLLTNKPMLVVVNVAVDRLDRADELAKPFGPDALSVCVEIEGIPTSRRPSPTSGRRCSPTSACRRACCPGSLAARTTSGPADVPHDRGGRDAGVVVPGRRQGARVRRRDPFRPPAGSSAPR